jgi:hypothetical protein
LSAAGWQVSAGLIACGSGGFVSSVRRYYAHCTALDDCLGSLCATLDETGLTEDTLLVFFSDHGDMLGSQGQIRKQRPFDEAVRSVPPSFAMPFLYLLNKAASFYQDRLGTNIGKAALKKERCMFRRLMAGPGALPDVMPAARPAAAADVHTPPF